MMVVVIELITKLNNRVYSTCVLPFSDSHNPLQTGLSWTNSHILLIAMVMTGYRFYIIYVSMVTQASKDRVWANQCTKWRWEKLLINGILRSLLQNRPGVQLPTLHYLILLKHHGFKPQNRVITLSNANSHYLCIWCISKYIPFFTKLKTILVKHRDWICLSPKSKKRNPTQCINIHLSMTIV